MLWELHAQDSLCKCNTLYLEGVPVCTCSCRNFVAWWSIITLLYYLAALGLPTNIYIYACTCEQWTHQYIYDTHTILLLNNFQIGEAHILSGVDNDHQRRGQLTMHTSTAHTILLIHIVYFWVDGSIHDTVMCKTYLWPCTGRQKSINVLYCTWVLCIHCGQCLWSLWTL